MKISGSVKVHIGDSWGKLIILVQFQHSSVVTFLHLNIYAWVPPPYHYILSSISTLKYYGILHLNIYISVPSTTPKKCQKIH